VLVDGLTLREARPEDVDDATAMPGVMATSVFGFSVTRHSFIGSITVGAAYAVLFVAFAVISGIYAQFLLQFAVVVSTLIAASTGAYLLERSQRTSLPRRGSSQHFTSQSTFCCASTCHRKSPAP
jgi:hypothetical protein